MTSDSADISARLVRAALPEGGWLVTLCEAYLDESEGQASIPVMTVGGYLFEASAAERFSKRAGHDLKKLGLPYFHQTDCANEGGPYRGFGKPKCIDSQNRLIRNIKKRSILGFACNVNIRRYEEIVGTGPRTPRPYTVALIGCMTIIRRWAEKTNYQGDIAYFFENGFKDKGNAASFLDEVILHDASKPLYRCVHWGFSDKRVVMPLAAADMIAWYTNQEFSRAQRGLSARRKDFEALLRHQDRRMDCDDKYLHDFRALMEEHGRI